MSERIAIVGAFTDLDGRYSPAHVAIQQAEALARAGHTVEIWGMDTESLLDRRPARFRRSDPEPGSGSSGTLETSYRSSPAVRIAVRRAFSIQPLQADHPTTAGMAIRLEEFHQALDSFQPTRVICHDLLLQRPFIDFAWALHALERSEDFNRRRWFHYFHSNLNLFEEVTANNRWRLTVPRDHWIIFPNHVGIPDAKERYRTDRVAGCHNVHDPRSYWNLDPAAVEMVTELDLMQADVVQILPFCMTRAFFKGVNHVIEVFDALAEIEYEVRLVCCVLNSQGLEHEMEKLKGDRPWLHFTNERFPEGVPHHIVSDLMRFSNIFILPSMSEACSLAMAEAQAAGCLCVFNQNVPGMAEMAGPYDIASSFDALRCKTSRRTERVHHDHDAGGVLVGTRMEVIEGAEADRIYIQQLAEQIEKGLIEGASQRHAFKTYSWETHARRLEEIFKHADHSR